MKFHPGLYIYSWIQWILDKLLSPTRPSPNAILSKPRIAVIGAGVTGVSAAAHCVGHGFDATIFEAGDEQSLGGIWSRVNSTSSLQVHSIMYRFHPSVQWTSTYPNRQYILSQITQLWKRYGLQERTKFNTRVTSVAQDGQKGWVINDPSNGRYDGVVVAVGTCGDVNMPHISNQEAFKGEIAHSSQLDSKTAAGKKVLIIGGGASAVEALEFGVHTGAASTVVLSRSEKWIIPRNVVIASILALNFSSQNFLSWIPESLLRKFSYRDLSDLAPAKEGLYTQTPMLSSDILKNVRDKKAQWLRGDKLGFTEKGVRFKHRAQGVSKDGPGQEIEIQGDMVIMATGYQRPSLSFLPPEVFEEPYAPPKWYLQAFPPKHVSICANNCTLVDSIGVIGNYHIGIYTRLLLMFLVDPLAQPQEHNMKLWIAMIQILKSRVPTAAFDFFTYAEMICWLLSCLAISPFRWRWAPFVISGVGTPLPPKVIMRND